MGGHPKSSGTSPRGPRGREGGFTLFELVLVLIVLALTATFVGPRVLRLADKRLDAAVRNAYALARHARSLAVTKGVSVKLCCDADEGRCWIEVEQDPFGRPDAFAPPGDEWGQGFRVAEDLRFTSYDVSEVVFRPDGTAADALIVLAEIDGPERKGLRIRGVTGLARVLEDDELAAVELEFAAGF